MKKLKHIVPFLLAMVMMLAIPLSGCNSCNDEKDNPPAVTTALQSISIDTANVKKDFVAGEQFVSDGLVVKAVMKKSDSETPYEETLAATQYTVDSSQYNANVIGKYTIGVSYTYEEVTKDASYDVTVSDVAITLDASAVKTLFLTTEDFSSEGLIVNRTIISSTGNTTEKLAATDFTVNSTKYKKEEGSYTITVSHTYGVKTVSAEYTVQVIEPRQGLAVSFKSDVEDTITLSSELTSADLSAAASWIEVKQPDSYGVVAEDAPALEATEYTVSVYKGQQKIETLTDLESGAYQIWAEKSAETEDGFDLKGFVTVYVVDDLESLTFNANAAGTKLTQFAGKDTISKTWQFTATYKSGLVKTLSFADLKTEDGKDLSAVTNTDGAKSVTGYFTHINSNGTTTVKNVTVEYTIEALSGVVNYDVTYSVDAGNGTAFGTSWGDNEGTSAQVSFVSTATTFKNKPKKTDDESVSFSNYAEVKDYASKHVDVTIGSGLQNVTITVYTSHTSKAERTAYLTKDGQDTTANLIDSATMGTTTANPTILYTLVAEDATAGTYSIFGGAAVHIYAIVVTYQVNYNTEEEKTYEDARISFGELTTGEKMTSIAGIGNLTVSNTETVVSATIAHTTSDTFSVKESSETFGDGLSCTKTYSTGGGSRTSRRAILLELVEGKNYTITVYAKTSADGRYVAYYQCASIPDSAYDFGKNGPKCTDAVGNGSVTAHTITVNTANGKYLYIGGDQNIDLCMIVVSVTD